MNKIYTILIISFITVSTVAQAQWIEKNNGLTNLFIHEIVSNDSNIFVATREGIFRSNNDGDNWQPINNGIETKNIFSLVIKDSFIFAGARDGIIYRSSDNGDTWTKKIDYLKLTSVFVLYIWKNVAIYAGTDDGTYYSDKNGETWMDNDFGTINMHALSFTAKDIKLNDNLFKDGLLFMGFDGVWKSFNGRGDWVKVSNGLTNNIVGDMIVKGNRLFAATRNGIHISDDNGENWVRVTKGNGTDNFVHAFAVYNDYIFAGTEGGVYISFDNGINWEHRNNTLTYRSILNINIKDDYIFAGDYRNGIYRAKISDLIATDVSEENETGNDIFTLFPNPANDYLNIRIKGKMLQPIKIKITDNLGIELINGNINNFTNRNISNLTTGVYYCKVVSENYTETRRFVVIK